MTRIMLDLETMDNTATSAITSIGAVAFNADRITDRFEVYVDLQSCIDRGFTLRASTIFWWMNNTSEARDQFLNRTNLDIVASLGLFSDWVTTVGTCEDVELWGNGAAFDNVILGNAYEVCKLKQPWMYYNDRCYRTVKAKYSHISAERFGVYRKAVDDAETQALHLIKIEHTWLS